MNLLEIRSHIQSDTAFKEYVEQDGDGGQTAFTLELIIQAIEIDGASLADFELLELIAEITYMWKEYEENRERN